MNILVKHTTLSLVPAVITSTSDFKKLYLSMLKEIYEKKCFFNVYVEEVIDIVRHGMAVADANNVSGNHNVDVSFSIRFSKIEQGYILCFIKVKYINEKHLICSNGDITAQVEPNAPIFEIGDEIPVIVYKSNYSTNNNIVIIGTSIIKCDYIHRKDIVTKLLPDTDEKVEEECKKLLEEIDNIESEIKKINNPLTDYFNTILTPKKDKRKPAGSIKDIRYKEGAVYLFRHDKVFDFNYYFEEKADTLNEVSISDAKFSMLKLYFRDLSNLCTMVKNYDAAKFKSHEHIYKLIDKRREKI